MKREEVKEIMSIGELFNTFKTWGMIENFYLGYEDEDPITPSTELEHFYVEAKVVFRERVNFIILMLENSTNLFKLIEPVERSRSEFTKYKFEKKKLS